MNSETNGGVGIAMKLASSAFSLFLAAALFGAAACSAAVPSGGQGSTAVDAAQIEDPYGLGFAVEDSDEDLEVETYQYGDILHYIYVFGSDYYDLCFDHAADEVTADGLKELVASNGGIPDEFKGRVCEFVDAAAAKYPDVDLRVLEHNLAGIEIADCEEGEVQETCSESTAGYYSESDNRICISSPNGYAKGTWDYQLLPHELCHAMRRARFEYEGNDVHIHPMAWDVEVVDEAFTSIVVGSLIGWPDGELAYQPEVNMVRVMLECVDGYELEDYYRQSLQRFAAKLDEACGDRNYAMTMFKLMQAQHDDYYDAEVNRDRAAYRPLYDYLARLYIDERAHEGMSPGAVDALMTELAERITLGVPEDYGYDVGEFYRFGQEYYAGKYGADSE